MESNAPRFRLRPSALAAWLLTRGLVLVAVLVAAEAVLRIPGVYENPWAIPPPARQDPFTEHEYAIKTLPYIHTHKPNVRYTQARLDMAAGYSINSYGFRGPEFAVEPVPGVRRLAVIGDSMMEGAFVSHEDVFATVLDRRLDDDGWEVLNFGIQGSSPVHMAANWDRYMHFRPDAVLLFFHSNDMYDDVGREAELKTAVHREYAKRIEEGGIPSDGPEYVLDAIVRRAWFGAFPGGPGGLAKEVYERRLGQKLTGVPLEGVPPAPGCLDPVDFETAWARTEAYLDAIAAECARLGVPLYATQASCEQRIMPESGCRDMATYHEEALAAWGDRNGVPFLRLNDLLTPEYETEGRPRILHQFDGHPNAYGHRLFADHVEKWLMPLLPQTPQN